MSCWTKMLLLEKETLLIRDLAASRRKAKQQSRFGSSYESTKCSNGLVRQPLLPALFLSSVWPAKIVLLLPAHYILELKWNEEKSVAGSSHW